MVEVHRRMDGKTLLTYITGSVEQELLLRNEYLVTENRILRHQITMRSVFSALMAYVLSRFRSHQSLRLENMALRHQLAVYRQTVKRPKLWSSDRLFWVWRPVCGRTGNRPWNSCSPAPSSLGRRNGVAITGDGSVSAASRAVLPFPKKSASSSRICGGLIRRGARPESWANSASWAST